MAFIQAPTATADIDPKLDAIRARLPPGYRIDIGGTAEKSGNAENSIRAVFPFAIVIVLTLLMIQLQSFQRTLLVVLTAPLGLIGVTASLLLFHAPFGFVAQLGVIALFGMIMRNSVILVDQIEQDIRAGHAARRPKGGAGHGHRSHRVALPGVSGQRVLGLARAG